MRKNAKVRVKPPRSKGLTRRSAPENGVNGKTRKLYLGSKESGSRPTHQGAGRGRGSLDLPASPLSCPCCGNARLYAGATSALSQGVICRRCGLTINRDYPDSWPKGTARLSPDARLRAVEQLTLANAVRGWNRRMERAREHGND